MTYEICPLCGCEEMKTWDEDHRDWKEYPHIDRYSACTCCGKFLGKATIKPVNDNWENIGVKINE